MLARQPIPGSPSRVHFKQLATALQEQYGPNARELDPGHWIYEVMTGGQRSHVVHLLLNEETTNGHDVARLIVHSPIGPLPLRFDLESMLRFNAQLRVGAICVEDFRNQHNEQITYLTLRASHPMGTVDYDTTWDMIEHVARIADSLEKSIFACDAH